jgi:hypothetical protein
MLNLVYIEVPAEAGTRLDFEQEGPRQILGYMMNRFAPEAAYIEAGMRAIFMVADLNEAQMTELMLIPAAAIPEMVGKAIEAVKKAAL